MSLIKQLWLGILVILLLALGGSFVISLVSAKQYLQEQLQLKNIDNANSLALSMSQLEKDPVTIELLVAAQFDTGHYQYIQLTAPDGQILVERKAEQHNRHIPEWFAQLANLQVTPGVAQIQDGWQQYATLTLESTSQFAEQSLWQNSIRLLQWFLIAALISGLVGTWILKYISRPLDMVVHQAEAIGERRFITSQEPRTAEFLRLVRAMNTLSGSVKTMLDKETRQLEILRRESQLDGLTGLYNRTHFFNLLDALLSDRENETQGCVFLVRLLNLAQVNNNLGRQETDRALKEVAAVLATSAEFMERAFTGRLNGSDFALVIAGAHSVDSLARQISTRIQNHLAAAGLAQLALPLAASEFLVGEERGTLMHRLDGALAQAELQGDFGVMALSAEKFANKDTSPVQRRNLEDWRQSLRQALNENKLELASFPVKTLSNSIIHFESPARLQLDQNLQPAGYFMPWASRLGLMPQIDLAVLKIALHQLSFTQTPLAINISAEALCDANFRSQALSIIEKEKHKAGELWLEFSESAALRHPAEFRNFCHSLHDLGCHLGLKHVGTDFARIENLQDLGLNYLKLDEAIIRDISSNPGNQGFIQSLCKIGQSLGMLLIASGVKTADEKLTLSSLGIDAFTGPGV
jgi:diguanylate cyclase (GGDEF)-like protein